MIQDNVIHMSLSDLLKKSAMQICYLRKNKEKIPPATQQQIEGNEAAHAKALDEKYIEMRGTYVMDYLDKRILIHYAFDEISPHEKGCLFIEHKNIKPGSTVELWYRNAAILQTGTYQAFARINPNKHLETAQFYIDQGNPKIEMDLGTMYLHSELHFGNWIYTVHVPEANELVDFYKRKAIASLDYDTARLWDDKYKRKEFDTNHRYIAYREMQSDETIKIK